MMTAGQTAPLFLECRAQIHSQILHGRNQSEKKAGDERDGGSESEDTTIDADVLQAWDISWIEFPQGVESCCREEQAEQAAAERQQHTFSEKLAHHLPTACANRRPNGH